MLTRWRRAFRDFEDLADHVKREAERLGLANEADPVRHRAVVYPVTGAGSTRRGYEPEPLVVAQRVGRHPCDGG